MTSTVHANGAKKASSPTLVIPPARTSVQPAVPLVASSSSRLLSESESSSGDVAITTSPEASTAKIISESLRTSERANESMEYWAAWTNSGRSANWFLTSRSHCPYM